jgi:hypothetical protein
VKWFKRYIIGCLVAVVVFAAVDRSHRPGQEMYAGAIILCAVGWPIVTAIVVGSTIGDIMNDMKQGK